MNALQLKLCDIQGRLFELFADAKYDAESLVKTFMCGELAKDLDSEYNRMQWMGEEYLLEELTSVNGDKLAAKPTTTTYDKDVLFWVGYTYRYWHFYTGEDSAKIYRQVPWHTMNANYLMFHTMDPSLAVDNLKEIYRQRTTSR